MSTEFRDKFIEVWYAAAGDSDLLNRMHNEVRIYNALYHYAECSVDGEKARPAYTLKDFATWSDAELLSIKNLGRVSIAELRPLLERAKLLNGGAMNNGHVNTAVKREAPATFEERLLDVLERIEKALSRLAEK